MSLSSPSSRHAKMLYEYIATRPGELSVAASAIVTVKSAPDKKNWVLVEKADGERGYVPADWLGEPDPAGEGRTRPVSFYSKIECEVRFPQSTIRGHVFAGSILVQPQSFWV